MKRRVREKCSICGNRVDFLCPKCQGWDKDNHTAKKEVKQKK